MNILTSDIAIDTSSVVQTKHYSDLQPGDEFEAWLGVRLKRVQALKMPLRDGNIVEIWVRGRKLNDRGKLKFLATAEVRVFTHPEILGKKAKSDRPKHDPDRYERIALCGLEGSIHPRSIRQIQDANLQKDFTREGLRAALKRMADEGRIKDCPSKKCKMYRLPIAWKTGMKVVENMGKASERYGWVTEIKEMRNGSLLPICQWLDGSTSPSSDWMLEICTSPYNIDRIAIAQLHAQGLKPEGFIKDIPWWMWSGIILRDVRNRGLVSSAVLLEIAKFLGFAGAETYALKHEVRERTIAYLNRFYPGWKQEQEQRQEQGVSA